MRYRYDSAQRLFIMQAKSIAQADATMYRNVRLKIETCEDLDRRGVRHETYDDIIRRMIAGFDENQKTKK